MMPVPTIAPTTTGARYKPPQHRRETRAPQQREGRPPCQAVAPLTPSSLTAFPHHRRLTYALPPF